MVKNKLSYLFFFCLVFAYCTSNKGVGDSTDYDEGNNVYRKKIGDYIFTLKPFPAEQLASVNYGNKELSAAEKDSILSDYKNFICFVFEIDIEGFRDPISEYDAPGKESDAAKKINYYLFGMQNDLKLRDGDAELPCTIYYHERMNEVTKINRFIIGFNRNETNQVTFEYDNPYLNCGKVNFSINQQHLALK